MKGKKQSSKSWHYMGVPKVEVVYNLRFKYGLLSLYIFRDLGLY